MARELHDTVGHTFTSSIMGIDAAVILMDKSPEKAKQKFIQLRDVMDEGLQEVRRNIHALTEDEEETPLAKQLELVSTEFAKHTLTEVDIKVYGKETEVRGSKKIALIRCLQESLTNALRHGQAKKIRVVLEFSSEKITLRIKDNGRGCVEIQPGFGLRSMEERMNALQGRFNVHSEFGRGTSITCTILNNN